MIKKSPWPFEQSHSVMLSAVSRSPEFAKGKDLSSWAQRCFAALSMTGRDLSGDEELSRAFEPCLKFIIAPEKLCEHVAKRHTWCDYA